MWGTGAINLFLSKFMATIRTVAAKSLSWIVIIILWWRPAIPHNVLLVLFLGATNELAEVCLPTASCLRESAFEMKKRCLLNRLPYSIKIQVSNFYIPVERRSIGKGYLGKDVSCGVGIGPSAAFLGWVSDAQSRIPISNYPSKTKRKEALAKYYEQIETRDATRI